MSMIAVGITTAVSVGTAVAGMAMSASAARKKEKNAKAQAAFELASTEKRIAEERERESENLLRLQEQKRKEISKQRAAFISSGVLPSSPSADFVIGELGENLQSGIQDYFLQSQDRQSSIRNQGSAGHFQALQNAQAASFERSAAIITGLSQIGSSASSYYSRRPTTTTSTP